MHEELSLNLIDDLPSQSCKILSTEMSAEALSCRWKEIYLAQVNSNVF